MTVSAPLVTMTVRSASARLLPAMSGRIPFAATTATTATTAAARIHSTRTLATSSPNLHKVGKHTHPAIYAGLAIAALGLGGTAYRDYQQAQEEKAAGGLSRRPTEYFDMEDHEKEHPATPHPDPPRH
eukprot:CAMPEP_0178501488 /NCGR_PEP_ID=MMETSP0696-20121128/16979_1 /TAXON_ID=265572 /ORGANISM="Extubocellulus spinifer, Strain CCMP396" /LENGTH=127 /DNA_ID=CAMNT_0020130445 /DNA_START=87 /DNA_END=470 /DNA_ORIENTATION=+